MNERDGFEQRLREARVRQGLEQPPKVGDGGGGLPPGVMGLGFRAGVEVVSALAVGVVVGLLLDRWLGTGPWLLMLFFVVGSAAGILNVYRLFNPRRPQGT